MPLKSLLFDGIQEFRAVGNASIALA